MKKSLLSLLWGRGGKLSLLQGLPEVYFLSSGVMWTSAQVAIFLLEAGVCVGAPRGETEGEARSAKHRAEREQRSRSSVKLFKQQCQKFPQITLTSYFLVSEPTKSLMVFASFS